MSLLLRVVFCCCFFIFICISTTSVGPRSAGPTFDKCSGLLELRLWVIDLKLFFDPARIVAAATNFCWLHPYDSY